MADDLDLSPDGLAALFGTFDSPQWPETQPTTARFEAWSPYVNAVIAGPPARSLAIALAAVLVAPEDGPERAGVLDQHLVEAQIGRDASRRCVDGPIVHHAYRPKGSGRSKNGPWLSRRRLWRW